MRIGRIKIVVVLLMKASQQCLDPNGVTIVVDQNFARQLQACLESFRYSDSCTEFSQRPAILLGGGLITKNTEESIAVAI